MFRSVNRIRSFFTQKKTTPEPPFSEDRLLTIAKGASIGITVLSAFVAGYIWVTQQQRGRKRAEEYQQANPHKTPRAKILPDEFQPEYIRQQKHKYQKLIDQRKRNQRSSTDY